MAIDTYSALASAVTQWMGRSGDTDILDRFPDLLKLQEQRMYYGAKEVPGLLPQFEPLRIREMETTDDSFTLGATVAQPTGFLELIEASLNSPYGPLRIEHEGVIAAYRDQTASQPTIIAVSGTNFRVWPDPGSSYTATLRYFQKLTTPAGATSNAILTTYPSLYLNGCLMQAYLMLGDKENAQTFAALYVAEVGGLNERRNSELRNATNVRLRVRGRTP
jgi:hypothetical protein